MSSAGLPDFLAADKSIAGIPEILTQPRGILSDDPLQNPNFHDWTHVYLWYCSSDSHLGDASKSEQHREKCKYLAV